jgi:hypothetical protein
MWRSMVPTTTSTRQVSATSTVGRVTGEVDSHMFRQRALEEARRTRGLILEVAVRADYMLGEALSSYLGADEDRRLLLTADVMWRVPVELEWWSSTERSGSASRSGRAE